MLCLPSTVSLGMASQLKLRILEARIGLLVNGPPPPKRAGGGGGGGGGALGGGGGGGGGIMIWMSLAKIMLHHPFKEKSEKETIWKSCVYSMLIDAVISLNREELVLVGKLTKKL